MSNRYSNSHLYRTNSEAPWIEGNGITKLFFSVPDVPSIDDDVTADILLRWAEIDYHGLWEDGTPLTVQHFEGPGDFGKDVYTITGGTQSGTEGDVEEYGGEAVAVPIAEIDGSLHFYQLDDFLF